MGVPPSPPPPLPSCHVPAHPQPITHFLPTQPPPPLPLSFSTDYHCPLVRHLLISRPPHYIAPLCPPRLTLSPTINHHELLLPLEFFLPALVLASANVDVPQDPPHASHLPSVTSYGLELNPHAGEMPSDFTLQVK